MALTHAAPADHPAYLIGFVTPRMSRGAAAIAPAYAGVPVSPMSGFPYRQFRAAPPPPPTLWVLQNLGQAGYPKVLPGSTGTLPITYGQTLNLNG